MLHCAEFKAWKIYRSLDVDYVFVVFGGMVGYSSDDVNKFLWMVRIGGGVYPEIKESDYLSKEGKKCDWAALGTLIRWFMLRIRGRVYPQMKESEHLT